MGPLPGEAYWMGACCLQSDHLREVNDEGDWPDQLENAAQQLAAPGKEGVDTMQTGQ